MIPNPLSAGVLVLISCWNHCVYGGDSLYWGLKYAWGCFHLAYVRRHNVSVSLGSGRYIVISEPRFTPGVGNHLGQSLGSYQQYSQVQINWSVSDFGFQQRVQEYHDLDNSFLDSFVFLPSFQLSIRTSNFLLAFLASSCFPSVRISSLPYFSVPSSL